MATFHNKTTSSDDICGGTNSSSSDILFDLLYRWYLIDTLTKALASLIELLNWKKIWKVVKWVTGIGIIVTVLVFVGSLIFGDA